MHKPDLKGAVIASNQTALEQDKNRFSTGGALTTSDLHNSAHYDGQAVGVNASVGNDAGKFGVKGRGGQLHPGSRLGYHCRPGSHLGCRRRYPSLRLVLDQ
ncbi:hypothetical protein [Comamonas sp. E6]|uniref:hypothetical protein n=1 Tax=Comamonas sp. E6 TaxID=364029 RepID=UPI000639E51E|nr:hypothetical protein [Comamonas sp. E6]GAO72649.1 adhesin [Comamonas sp. E6]